MNDVRSIYLTVRLWGGKGEKVPLAKKDCVFGVSVWAPLNDQLADGGGGSIDDKVDAVVEEEEGGRGGRDGDEVVGVGLSEVFYGWFVGRSCWGVLCEGDWVKALGIF